MCIRDRFVTVTAIPPSPCSAKADGVTAISEKIASNENDKHTDFFILEFFSHYAYILVFSELLPLGEFNMVQRSKMFKPRTESGSNIEND